MTLRHIAATATLCLAVAAQAPLRGAAPGLPVRGGRPIVATVNGQAIFLDELEAELDRSADRAHLRKGYGRAADFEVLDRLVNVRLVAEEAARMGLSDLPEIRKQVEVQSRAILREVLLERLVKDVRPDPAAVERHYKELVREWKTESLLFEDEGAARQARAQIDKGRPFAEIAIRAIAEKHARAERDERYHRREEYLPEIAAAIAPLQVGQVSPVIRIPAGFVLVQVVDIRYPEDAQARAEARRLALNDRQQAVLQAHDEALRRKYAVIHREVLDSIDYEAARPGLDALLADTRVVAEIKGDAPVTVGDLTDYLRMQFFHGTDQAGQRQRMNARKEAALHATLGRRLLNMEARRLGIDRTAAYRDRVAAFERALVFDTFVQKVIARDQKVQEDEVKRYHAQHASEYVYPEMVRLRSLAFATRAAAEDAMRKLKGGTDFAWVSANAPGQIEPARRALAITDGRPVATDSMPEELRRSLANPKAGDIRLHAGPEGQFYVLAIQDVIAARPRPYDEVREAVAKKLYGEKVAKSMDDYIRRLRAASKIQIHLARMR